MLSGSRLDRWLRERTGLSPFARWEVVLRVIGRRSTARRIRNLLQVEWEYRLRRVQVRGRPYVVVVDPINACNLRCPLCPTGLRTQGRRSQPIAWQEFVRVIDELAPFAYKVNLFNWGEPLLHRQLPEMIQYAHRKGLATSLATNLSLVLDDERIKQLLLSGLDFLSASIDGACQTTYQRYRQGGDFELVKDNLHRLVSIRRRLGRTTPRIEWQFIRMQHNQDDIPKARALAKSIGVDRFRVIDAVLPFDRTEDQQLANSWQPRHKAGHRARRRSPRRTCPFLYRYVVVNPDGGVSPCCRVYGVQNDFGNVGQSTFSDLWNGSSYTAARALFAGMEPTQQTVCEECDVYRSSKDLSP